MPPTSQFNSKSPTIRRILREAAELSNTPSPDYTATPLDEDLFEWHFTLRGPPGSTGPDNPEGGPYHDGIYHGRIVLPPSYPLRPPSFRFLTPSGRFETNREICLSISGHHEETWQPAWGLRTALVALRSFMETDPKGQLGGLECTDAMRRRMAKDSQSWKCSSCAKSNGEILKECTEAAKNLDPKPEVEVPKDLKMGWRDEMKQSAHGKNDSESSEMAEGFVQTTPLVIADPAVSSGLSAPRPAQGVPQPTSTIRVPPQQPQLAAQIRNTNTGVPDWVDKAIVGIAACLIVMILRMLL